MNAVEKANMTEQKSVKSLNKKKSKNKKNQQHHQQQQQHPGKLDEINNQSLTVNIKVSSEKTVYELNSIDQETINSVNGDTINGDLNELTSHINENGCIEASKSDKNLSSSPSLSNESEMRNGRASTSSSPQQHQSSKSHVKKNNTNVNKSSLSMQSHTSIKVLELQNDQQPINKQQNEKNELPSHVENNENTNNRLTKKHNKKSKNKSTALTTTATKVVIENSQNNANISTSKHKNNNSNKNSTTKPTSKLYTVSNSGELLSSINLEINDDDDIDDDIEDDEDLLENKLELTEDGKKTGNENITNILSLSSSSSSNQCCKKTAIEKITDGVVKNDLHINRKIDNENVDNNLEMGKIENQNDNNNSDRSSKNNNNNNKNININNSSNHSDNDDNELNSNSNSSSNTTVINSDSCYISKEDEKSNLPKDIEPSSSSSLKTSKESAKSVTDDNLLSSSSLSLPSSTIDRSNIVIEYKEYESELQMQDIMRLIQTELSEPYSIYTYRYFIYNWPKLCFLAAHGNEYVGAIVCKLDMHMNVKRGYIAMLAVKKEYRKLRIGTNLVQKAIEAMLADNADEVVLETEMKNIPALRLYENLGFVRDKRLFRYYLNGVDALRLKLWFR